MMCNWDQTASEIVKHFTKSVIVGKSMKQNKYYYRTTASTGHITRMAAIFPDGPSSSLSSSSPRKQLIMTFNAMGYLRRRQDISSPHHLASPRRIPI